MKTMNGVLRYYSDWNTEAGAYDIFDRQSQTKIDQVKGYAESTKRVDDLNAEDRKDVEPFIPVPTGHTSSRNRDKIEVEPLKIYKE